MKRLVFGLTGEIKNLQVSKYREEGGNFYGERKFVKRIDEDELIIE